MQTALCREDLKMYCLRQLGHPLLQINVHPEQIEDRIDDALKIYWEFHEGGSYRDFITHELTQDEISSKIIEVDPWVFSVLRLIPLAGVDTDLNLEYQSFMQALGNQVIVWGEGLVNYTVGVSFLNLVYDYFKRIKIMDFKYSHHKLYLRSEMNEFNPGDIIILEVYKLCDPDVYRETWDNWFLKGFATALIKKQWGTNMKKYQGVQLPSGVTLDGQTIFNEALEEIAQLKADLFSFETLPPNLEMG